jgi:hypothetical protein
VRGFSLRGISDKRLLLGSTRLGYLGSLTGLGVVGVRGGFVYLRLGPYLGGQFDRVLLLA